MPTSSDILRGTFVSVSLTLLCAPALASDLSIDVPTCEANSANPGADRSPDMLDPMLRGVALADLELPEARTVSDYLRAKGVLPLSEVLSTSIVELYQTHVVVDVVGRAARFSDSDTKKHKHGRVGVMRVKVPVASTAGVCDVGAPETIWERSLAELDLRYRVSISEWSGVIEDRHLGFRRVWPLGGGGIDRGVRYVGLVSSMTPVIPDGLLDKAHAWRELGSPWYFRRKPYLPISIARTFTRQDGTQWKSYFEGKIAFHIWQDKGFERGFFSHGCMRMRTEDLAELAAFVFGQRAPFPVTVALDAQGDARHPYPMDTDKYWQLKNHGTPDKPEIRLKYMLHEMELGTEPLPDPSQFTAMTWDSKPILPPGTPTPKATKVIDPWSPR